MTTPPPREIATARSASEAPSACRLTGDTGPFVKSHLIPVALTRLSKTGEMYVEAGIGWGQMRRASSWYDSKLVSRLGEDILAEIDDRGIKALRANKLIWSSWGTAQRQESEDLSLEGGRPAWRMVRMVGPDALRLFFQSLAWRAAASQLPEFAEITLAPHVVEDLRRRVIARDPGPPHDYAVQLFQVISRGVDHNRTPLLEEKYVPMIGMAPVRVPYIRFWFDGLVAHFHVDSRSLPADYLATTLGAADPCIVFVNEFEDSRAFANFKEMVATVTAEAQRPPTPMTAVARAAMTAAGRPPR